jgi:peptide-N4-(N-acetyl-beta-glucosaminyl)asparagine amidase
LRSTSSLVSNLTHKRFLNFFLLLLPSPATLHARATEISAAESGGRESGSVAWRQSRQELGGSTPAAADGATSCTVPPADAAAGSAASSGAFVVSPDQLAKTGKHFRLRYSAARDVYIRNNDTGAPERRRWAAGASLADNIYRNEEHDWQMVYLARVDAARNARIEWTVDFAPCGRKIVAASLAATRSLHGTKAAVAWSARDAAATGDAPWTPLAAHNDQPTNGSAYAAVPITDTVRGWRGIVLRADIIATEGGSSQHEAQLLRTELQDRDRCALDLKVTLEDEK